MRIAPARMSAQVRPMATGARSMVAEWLKLIKEYPALVKRPVVVKDSAVSVGFTEKKFKELFGG